MEGFSYMAGRFDSARAPRPRPRPRTFGSVD